MKLGIVIHSGHPLVDHVSNFIESKATNKKDFLNKYAYDQKPIIALLPRFKRPTKVI